MKNRLQKRQISNLSKANLKMRNCGVHMNSRNIFSDLNTIEVVASNVLPIRCRIMQIQCGESSLYSNFCSHQVQSAHEEDHRDLRASLLRGTAGTAGVSRRELGVKFDSWARTVASTESVQLQNPLHYNCPPLRASGQSSASDAGGKSSASDVGPRTASDAAPP